MTLIHLKAKQQPPIPVAANPTVTSPSPSDVPVKVEIDCKPEAASPQPEEKQTLLSPETGIYIVKTDPVPASSDLPHNLLHPNLQPNEKSKFTTEQLLDYYNPIFNWKLPYIPPANGWVAVKCPFHQDHQPSFGLNLKHGGFSCHSSACDSGSGDIYKFHMLYKGVSFPVAQKAVDSLMTTKTTYVYTDDNGADVHYVERTDGPDGKQFYQFHKGATGKLPGLPEGTKLYPYHLPELLKENTVYIVEGEKCCDSLRHCLQIKGITDIAVTTFCGGCNGWKSHHYAPYFQGKAVVLFPDYDKNGYKFARHVAAGISSVAKSLKLVTIPIPNGAEASGYDIHDFLYNAVPCESSAATLKRLKALVDSAVDTNPDHIAKTAQLLFPESPIALANDPIPPLVTESTSDGWPQMPEDSMYGWAGKRAKEIGTPLSFAYPAMLAACSVMSGVEPTEQVRSNLYVCLIGPKGGSKSVTCERAVELAGLDQETLKEHVPGSDKGLYKMLGGDGPKGKGVLLLQDELRNTLSKLNIKGSSLPATLCTLWGKDTAGSVDKSGEHPVDARLSILGGLKADDGSEFAEVFGSSTNDGLVDRFLFGLSGPGWKWTTWAKTNAPPNVVQSQFMKNSWQKMYDWRDAKKERNGRLGEMAMRIALITSSVNGDKFVQDQALDAAFHFCEWQELIASIYKSGVAETPDGRCTEAIMTALESLPKGVSTMWSKLAKWKHWYKRFGTPALIRCREALVKEGVIGFDKKTGKVWIPIE